MAASLQYIIVMDSIFLKVSDKYLSVGAVMAAPSLLIIQNEVLFVCNIEILR